MGASDTQETKQVDGRVVLLAMAVLGVIVLVAMAIIWHRRPTGQPLPVLATLTSFDLRDQKDHRVTLADYAGKVWVADFIFTSCPSVCPKLTGQMKELSDHLVDADRRAGHDRGVRLVSFSIDPENDTPQKLAAYAAKFGADQNRWSFLTGPLDEVTRAVHDGMKIPFARTGPGATEVMHGERFVLVDPSGHIRAYFDVKEGLGEVEAGIDAVVAENRQ